jgi:predicted phosphodiesterase
MKIALVADIHGNVVALDRVLAILDEELPDQIVCLGDVAAKGPAPREVVERLMARDWIFIMGNTDEWMIRPIAETPTDERERKLIESALWGYEQLNEEQRAFIAAFRPSAAIETAAGPLLCYHGSPESNVIGILPDSPQAEVDALLNPWPAAIYAGAHTHIRMLRPHYGAVAINPGSAGMATGVRSNGEHLLTRAEFAILEIMDAGARIDFREVALDPAALVASVRASTTPDAEWWIEGWSR